ncbi:MAG: molybdopterin molybdenumtransferase MoeA, partial [Pelagibacterales bacterium]|nr:molybdopterin molybdenumtransferase MoeA [Pelagibacterales bacterium]
MLNVQKAINIIVSKATSLQEETILLKNSLGRICSKNIYSNINSPPENVSSMDGYALKYSNLKNINKIPIKIVGESAAGNPYIKKLNNYECVEIYTGAEVPKGA